MGSRVKGVEHDGSVLTAAAVAGFASIGESSGEVDLGFHKYDY
jgi:hypothetical protein